MGLLKGLLSAGGAVVGGMVGGPAGAKIGASIGGAAGGALSSSGGSKKATQAQLDAIREGRQIAGQAYQDVRDIQSPYTGLGGDSANALTARLGVSPTSLPVSNIGGGNALTAGSAGAAPSGSGPLPQSGTSPGTYGTTANPSAPTPYASPEAPGGFNFDTEAALNSPILQAALERGAGVIQSSAAAKGALNSGATLKALNDFGVRTTYDFLNDERDFAYGVNRDQRTDFNTDRGFGYGLSRDARADYQDDRGYLTGRFDRGTDDLFRGVSVGQGAANTVSNAASRYGDQAVGLVRDAGDARATNALTQGQIGSGFATGLGGMLSSLVGGSGGVSRAADISGLGQANYGNSLRMPSVRY
jgi:hypothetical protein